MDEKDLEKLDNFKQEMRELIDQVKVAQNALKTDCQLCKAGMQNQISEINATLYGKSNVKGLINKFDDFSVKIETQLAQIQKVIYKAAGALTASLAILNTILFFVFRS